MKRILIVKMSSLGDLFHALPAVHLIKQHTGATVDWVVHQLVCRPGRMVVLAWFGIGAMGGQKMGQFSQVQKNDSSEFLPASVESRQVQEAVRSSRAPKPCR